MDSQPGSTWDAAQEALHRRDGPGLVSALHTLAAHAAFREHLQLQALAQEVPLTLRTMPALLSAVIAALSSPSPALDKAWLAPWQAATRTTYPGREGGEGTLWVAALLLEGSLDRSRPTIERHGATIRIRGLSEQERTRPRSPDPMAEGLTLLERALAARFFDEVPPDAVMLTALMGIGPLLFAFEPLDHWLWLLEAARRAVLRAADAPETAAAAVLLLAWTRRERGLDADDVDLLDWAAALAPAGSVQRAMAEAWAVQNAERLLIQAAAMIDQPAVRPREERVAAVEGHARRLAIPASADTVRALCGSASRLMLAGQPAAARRLWTLACTLAGPAGVPADESMRWDQAGQAAAVADALVREAGTLAGAAAIGVRALQPRPLAAPAAKRSVFSAFGFGGAAPRGLVVLQPPPQWRRLHALASGGTALVSYGLEGDALDDWRVLLECTCLDVAAHLSFDAQREALERTWADLSTDGEVLWVDPAALPELVRAPGCELVGRQIVVVERDTLAGNRLDLHEVWQQRQRAFVVKLSLVGDDLEGLAERAYGEGKPFELVELDFSEVDAARIGELVSATRAGMSALLQRLLATGAAAQDAVTVTGAMREALASPFTREVHDQLSALISGSSNDPMLFAEPVLEASVLRRRLQWTPPGSAAEATTLEQFALALVREDAAQGCGPVVPLLLSRACMLHQALGDTRGALRALSLMIDLVDGRLRPEVDDARVLDRVLGVREQLAGNLPELARIDLLIGRLLALGDWPQYADRVDQALALVGEARAIADQTADEALDRGADAAQGTIVHASMHPALRRFERRRIRDIVEADGPICRFLQAPLLGAIYLRALDSSNALRIRHALPAEQLARVRRLPGAELDDGRITLEGALAVTLAFSVETVGGESDVVGAARARLSGGNWKQIVGSRLASFARALRDARQPRSAHLVFMVPARSAGVLWEMRALRRLGLLPITCFIMPPADAVDGDAAADWNGALATWTGVSGCAFPLHRPDGALLHFDAAGTLVDDAPFDDLWSGHFAARLLARVAASAGTMHQMVWQMPDLVD